MRVLATLALFLVALCGQVSAQTSTLPGFPPGLFQNKAASDPPAGGGGSCTINSVSLGSSIFTGGAASGTVVGAISVSTTGTCGTDTLAVTGTNAADFQISSTNLETSGVQSSGNYSINVVATISGATGSPFTLPVTVCGAGSHAATWLARPTGQSNLEGNSYCQLINGLDTDSTYALFDALYIFSTNTTTTALLNLVSTNFSITSHGSCTFTADHGYTGDGSSCYLDTGLTPSTCGGSTCNFSNSSAMHGVYVQTNSSSTPGVEYDDIGANNDNTVFNYMIVRFTDTNSYCEVNSSANNSASGVGNTDGLWMCFANSTTSSFYRNGSSIGSGSASAGAVPTLSYYILARHCDGSSCVSPPANNFSVHQLSAAWIGTRPTGTQATNISSRINTFMTALGINVY